MKYFILDLHTDVVYGPFNTFERAKAFKKKHHIYGTIFEETIDK